MDYYGDGASSLSQDERDFLRLIQYSTWRMARAAADQNPEALERFIDYAREELRRLRGEKFSAGFVSKK